jgi:hypothetical protein
MYFMRSIQLNCPELQFGDLKSSKELALAKIAHFKFRWYYLLQTILNISIVSTKVMLKVRVSFPISQNTELNTTPSATLLLD